MQKGAKHLWFLLLALGMPVKAAPMEHAVVLSPNQVGPTLKQCSRLTPQNVDGAWGVPPAVVAQLEQDLNKLSGLKSSQCCDSGRSVKNPGAYLRQYVGVTIRGKKYVYINAFEGPITHLRHESLDVLMHRPVIICDGGDAFWGALYDPETRTFSALAFNGVA
jgi:hypothetical protein